MEFIYHSGSKFYCTFVCFYCAFFLKNLQICQIDRKFNLIPVNIILIHFDNGNVFHNIFFVYIGVTTYKKSSKSEHK